MGKKATDEKISILMPVYNTASYLPKTMESLLAQTYGNIEIVCVDDGSTDGSLAVLEKYAKKDARVKVLHQENSGVAAARNRTLDNATGKYVMFCDSDDTYEQDMCGVMLSIMERERVDMVACQANVRYDIEGDISKYRDYIYWQNTFTSGRYRMDTTMLDDTLMLPNILLWNKIMKKSIIDGHKIRFPDGHEHDDDAFFYEYAFVAGDIYYTQKKLYNYIIRADSIMYNYINKKPRNRYDRLAIADFIFDFLTRNGLLEKNVWAIGKIYAKQLSLSHDLFSRDELRRMMGYANARLKGLPVMLDWRCRSIARGHPYADPVLAYDARGIGTAMDILPFFARLGYALRIWFRNRFARPVHAGGFMRTSTTRRNTSDLGKNRHGIERQI